MPITFAHPAFILPLTRLRRESGWLGGLVAGSIAPDILQAFFGHFERLPHSLPGIVLLDVPLAVALTWIAHKGITPRLRRMPGLEAIRRPTGFSWKWATLAALIGATTHLGLDLFTHGESPLASTADLAVPLLGPGWSGYQILMVLWYVSSVLGTLVLIAWLALRARGAPGGFGRFLSWPWAILACAVATPMVPILLLTARIFVPDAVEMLYRLTSLADAVRVSLFLSSFAGILALYAVTTGRSGQGERDRNSR